MPWQACTVDATRPRIAVYLDGRRVQGDDRRRVLAALRGAGIVIRPGQELQGWIWRGGGLVMWERERPLAKGEGT